ncbi:putative sulfate exporter family transporter [Paenibacillus oralis]|uniref:Putative sulfate exporter family transporter n=2 Tax=Paenibacillus oralis TaxID=2490856 RepID=A0A3P3UDI6_9BACL|nr:putative sulfate exporter family transporter [Paenibacillus oralis]
MESQQAKIPNAMEKKLPKPKNKTSVGLWLSGIAFTVVIAAIGFALSKFPMFDHVGPLACAIVIAVIYRQFFGYPEALWPGIQFSAKRLLRFAIILFGLKLNIDTVLHQGVYLLVRDMAVVGFAILTTVGLGKALKAADVHIGMLSRPLNLFWAHSIPSSLLSLYKPFHVRANC